MRRGLHIAVTALLLPLAFACAGALEDSEDALEAELGIDEDSPAEPDSSDPYELLSLMLEGPELAAELASFPVHAGGQSFDQIGVLYEGPIDTSIAISTSVDGESWSEWLIVEVAPEGEPDESGRLSFSGKFSVVGGALFYRVIGVSESVPSFLSLELLDSAISDEETVEDTYEESADPLYASTSRGLAPFKRFRFDSGRVSKPWLWLLKTARRKGWNGRLAGSRTGLRTYRQQEQLYNDFLAGRGAPAFPPWGPSRHLIRNVNRRGRWSMAIDTQDVSTLIRIASRKGVRLHVPYSNEPWHVEARRYFRQPRGWNP